jgi:tetratricopeptide (TPR) repeat protein
MFTLRRFLALFASRALTPYEQALRDLAHGRSAQALERLDALLAAEMDAAQRARLSNKRGVALVALGRAAQARDAFEAALRLSADFPPALVNLGNLELEAGRPGEAVPYYERAIAKNAELASAHRHLGLAYKRVGRTNEAMAAFSRARKLEGRTKRGQST